MISHIIRLLGSNDLGLETRRILLANYFSDICREPEVIKMTQVATLASALRCDLLEHYMLPAVRSDSQVRSLLVPVLQNLASNPKSQPLDVLARALEALAAYGDTTMLQALEVYIDHVSRASEFYGALAEHLCDSISNKKDLFKRITHDLFGMARTPNLQDASLRLFLDIVYCHYRLSPDVHASEAFVNLLKQIRTLTTVRELGKFIPQFRIVTGVDGICLVDTDRKLQIVNYVGGDQDTYKYKQHSIRLDNRNLAGIAQQLARPILVRRQADTKEFFTQFDTYFREALIVPCLYFSKASTILIALTTTTVSYESALFSAVLAKYTAGASTRLTEELDIVRMDAKIIHELSFLIKGLQHDVSKSVAITQNYLFTLKKQAKKAADREMLENCTHACSTISESVESVLAIVEPRKVQNDVNKQITVVVKAFEYAFTRARIFRTVSLDPACPSIAAAPGLPRVFVNLILNAIDALGEKAQDRKITISSHYTPDEHAILVKIGDNGRGIREDIRDKMFLPYVSSSGGGWGLPVCKFILNEIGGTLDYTTSARGTEFQVRIPIGG